MTVRSRAEWRDWLAAHHGQAEPIWLVTFRKGNGRRHLPWSEIFDEALCFGWIDSLPRKLDDDRTMLLVSPRRRGSRCSAINKAKVASLIRDGLMRPPGEAKVAQANADGTWSALDHVDSLIVPDDLAAALDRDRVAAARFSAFPPTARKAILEWIATAKKPDTRARRVAETVRLAAENIRANRPPASAAAAGNQP